MSDEDDELLIRLHFGDLDGASTDRLRARLEQEPDLAARYAELEACLDDQQASDASESDCLGGSVEDEGLADRTAHRIAAAPMTVDDSDATRWTARRRFSFGEVVAIGVAAGLVGMMVMPALNASRGAAQRIACQDNLRTLGQSLTAYAADHGDYFPEVAPTANAGVFTIELASGYLPRRELSRVLVCPSSELATEVSAGEVVVQVPTIEQLRMANARLLERMRRYMAGSYAYRMGHWLNGRYVTRRYAADCRAPLLADAPQFGPDNVVVSRNHGSCGQNVLFEDGHVAFQSDCWTPAARNHLYLNDAGQIAAGHGPRDVVLGGSQATPGVVRVAY